MIQLRWAVLGFTTTDAPVLQYRVLEPGVEFETGKLTDQNSHWTEWQDVPRIVVTRAPSRRDERG